VPSGPVTWPDLRFELSASDRERPFATGVNGPLMAGRSSLVLWPPEGALITQVSLRSTPWRTTFPAVPRTSHQELGEYGESVVVRLPCPKCKRASTLRRLPVNFRCADIICDFCGYLAQVKTTRRADVGTLPPTLMGAAWGPQHDRMEAGIYFPLFIVIVNLDRSATGQPMRSTTCPPTSSSRRCSSNGSLFGRRRVEPDGWATCCGLTCLEVTGQSGWPELSVC
jgi:hypothetical protein